MQNLKIERLRCSQTMVGNSMRWLLSGLLVGGLLLTCLSNRLVFSQQTASESTTEITREIFVPFADLHVLMENNSDRVLMSREEYQTLLESAKTKEIKRAPEDSAIIDAAYSGTIESSHATITGSLIIESLNEGWLQIPLKLSGVVLREALLDGVPANLRRDEQGEVLLLVSGQGRKKLTLSMSVPLETTAARQSMALQLPAPASARFDLTVPGNVEVKSGATVVERTYDTTTDRTRFELLVSRAPMNLLMSLNNRVQKDEQVVVANSVLIHKLNLGNQELQILTTMDVIHGAIEKVNFKIPAGYQIQQVATELLAQWEIRKGESEGDELRIQLREPTREDVELQILASREVSELATWRAPDFRPLDVAGHISVVGILADAHLRSLRLTSTGVIPIDHVFLEQIVPRESLTTEAANPLMTIGAFYAPRADYTIESVFEKPAPEFQVKSSTRMVIGETRLELQVGLSLLSGFDSRFGFDLSLPEAWHIYEVTGLDGGMLPFDRDVVEGRSLIHVRLPARLSNQQATQVFFKARATPPSWLDAWETISIEFPNLVIAGTTKHTGALAVSIGSDHAVRPLVFTGLEVMDLETKKKFDVDFPNTPLTFQFSSPDHRFSLEVERLKASTSVRSFTFFEIKPNQLHLRSELDYHIKQSKTDLLKFQLPLSTPASIDIRATDLGGSPFRLKDFRSETVGNNRQWTVQLAQPITGEVRIVVSYQQPLVQTELSSLTLTPTLANDVQFQTALVAVEGSADLDVALQTNGRTVDENELSSAAYKPGRFLLGAFDWPMQSGSLVANCTRRSVFELPAAIVQRAAIVTSISATGKSQTAARFQLVTDQSFLRVQLPNGSTLWSVLLNGKPTKPQRQGESILISLTDSRQESTTSPKLDVQLVYESSTNQIGLWGEIEPEAPSLWLHTQSVQTETEVPLVDMSWTIYLPSGYRVAQTDSNFQSPDLIRRPSFLERVAGMIFVIGGGIQDRSRIYQTAYNVAPAYATKEKSERTTSSKRSSTLAKMPEGEYFAPGIDRQSEPTSGDAVFQDGAESEDESRPRVDRETRDDNGVVPPQEEEDAPSASTVDQAPGSKNAEGGGGISDGTSNTIVSSEFQPDAPVLKPKSAEELWVMSGLRSLNIQLTESSNSIEFSSLGSDSKLRATVVHRARIDWLAIAMGLFVLLGGLLLTKRSAREKIRYLLVVLLIGSLPPLASSYFDIAQPVFDAILVAIIVVSIYFVLVWFVQRVRAICSQAMLRWSIPVLIFVAAVSMSHVGIAQEVVQDIEGLSRSKAQLASDPEMKMPGDAIIIPYDADDPDGRKKADRLLLPYEHYLRLLQQADPEKANPKAPPPVDFVLAAANYETTLALEEDLLVQGKLQIDLLSDKPTSLALPLEGCALVEARVNGQPAKLQISATDPNAASQLSVMLLHLTGQGRKSFEFSVRIPLQRQGGWRSVNARLPIAIAQSLDVKTLSDPTEVRLNADGNVRSKVTASAESIATVLGSDGSLSLQWKPSTATQVIDQSLTVQSEAIFDVREDGLRLAWRVELDFRGAERNAFQLNVPAGYLVERVTGDNIRGWSMKSDGDAPLLDVTLLANAKDREAFLIELSQSDFVIDSQLKSFYAPYLSVAGAALQKGMYTIRHSPIIELKSLEQRGASRTDSGREDCKIDLQSLQSTASPLGIEEFQCLRFVATPFVIGLQAKLMSQEVKAESQTIFRLGQTIGEFESRINYRIGVRPIYELNFDLPTNVEVSLVSAGQQERWTTEPTENGKRIHIYFPLGVSGQLGVVLNGKLTDYSTQTPWRVPVFKLNDVASQTGQLAIQVDPSLSVSAGELVNSEPALLQQFESWLNPEQRTRTRLALQTRGAEYGGTLTFTKIQPRLSVESVTNVRITPFAIEETILLDFDIQQAGVRQLTFYLPESMNQALITAPLIRQKTVLPANGLSSNMVQVVLDLQDEVIQTFRVVVENDRQWVGAQQPIPLPEFDTGVSQQRFVTLQNAGRDELKVLPSADFEQLNPQLSQFTVLMQKLGGAELTMAYIAKSEISSPQLNYETNQREAVETVAASIGFAKTSMIVDASGAYRALQNFQVNNRSEQYLDVELPVGAKLLTVGVHGIPVKPVVWPTTGFDRRLRIPLIKTPSNELDYPVQLKYAGELGDLSLLRQVEFPAIEALNIRVQLSQLHLRLPESHQWANFLGTMTKVDDRGELEIGFLDYKNKQINQLTEQLRSTKLSASSKMSNKSKLDALQSEISQYRARAQGLGAQVDSVVQQNERAIQKAQSDLDVSEMDEGKSIDDNRGRFKQLVTEQKSESAFNSITRSARNFDASGKADGKPSGGNGRMNFNSLRFSQNQIPESKDANKELPNADIASKPLGKQELAIQTQDFDRQSINLLNANDRESALDLKVGNEETNEETSNSSGRLDSNGRDLGNRGGEKYELPRSETFTVPNDDPVSGGGGSGGGQNYSVLAPITESISGEDFSARIDVGGQAPAQPSNATPYLASLDIELPARGVDYYFKSPRGNVSVSARAIPRSDLNRGFGIIAIIIACSVVWLGAKAIRWFARSRIVKWVAIFTLVIGGCYSLVTGILPVYGTLALLIGITLIVASIKISRPQANPVYTSEG
jgi:hypothetical protein